MSDNLKEALERARERRARSTFTASTDSEVVNTAIRRAVFGNPAPVETVTTQPRSGGSADGGKGQMPTPSPPDINTLIRKASRRGY